MANHDENYRDSSGVSWIVINIAALVWVTMPVSAALLTVVQW